MDCIELRGLRFHAYHGVMEQERNVGNEFEVDLLMEFDATRAMEHDSLGGTIDYTEVVSLVEREMANPSKLLEHVAYRIRQSILLRFARISHISVRVTKLAPPLSRQIESVSFRTDYQR